MSTSTNDISKYEKLKIIREKIAIYPDFPKPGIEFLDIFSVLADPSTFQKLKDLMIDYVSTINPRMEAVAALDARGFLFGPIIALHFNIPFIPIRKKGKLPGKTHSFTYKLEYGEDTLEIQETKLKKGTKILLVDDLVATGGSLTAGCKLLQQVGFDVVQCLVVLEIKALNGRATLNAPLYTIIEF